LMFNPRIAAMTRAAPLIDAVFTRAWQLVAEMEAPVTNRNCGLQTPEPHAEPIDLEAPVHATDTRRQGPDHQRTTNGNACPGDLHAARPPVFRNVLPIRVHVDHHVAEPCPC